MIYRFEKMALFYCMNFSRISLIIREERGIQSFEVTVERISVCNVFEKLLEHGIHCLSCSYINDVLNILA